MSRKKISTTIYVTPEQSDRLKLLHERTKVPVAVYIREGIDLVLQHYGHLLPGQLPLGGSGQLEMPARVSHEPRAVSSAISSSASGSGASGSGASGSGTSGSGASGSGGASHESAAAASGKK